MSTPSRRFRFKVKSGFKLPSKRFLPALLLAGFLPLFFPLQAGPLGRKNSGFSADRYLADVQKLSGEEFQGRGNGTAELNAAARFLARRFRKIGLKPLPAGGDYLQRFLITTSAKQGKGNTLHLTGAGGTLRFEPKKDFRPLSFSSNGEAEGGVVFAGYGITADEYGYDDYQGLDVEGKFVIVLLHEPQEHDEDGVFQGRQFTAHSRAVHKAINAKNRGAAGLILVSDVGNHSPHSGGLLRFGTFSGPPAVGIPAIQLRIDVVERWFKAAGRSETVQSLREAIDRDLETRSFSLGDELRVALETEVEQICREVANIVGYLPGWDPRRKEEYIVIGAHYDHLGMGGNMSLAGPGTREVHYGADDNASGTSGLLELARRCAGEKRRWARSVIFVAFAAEELGILGSNYYTSNPPAPLKKTVAMLNMDMIGRVKKGRLYVGGTGSASEFRSLLEDANREVGLDLKFSISAYGASDHTSFAVKGIPVLFFFSGLHRDYHRPSDTWEKIDAQQSVRVLDLVYRVAGTLNRRQERPRFVRAAEPSHGSPGSGGGYGPYFGSVPDFGEVESGVRFADIRDGSPAEKAGFRAGDVLVEFDGKKIENLYDFTYALRACKPGDRVRVMVRRGEETVTAQVTLAVR